ncbi:HNH endonuclease [Calothrix sp. FACHB-1219]|uniref:HNH endonuclease n=1 Tax=unclassified Calothrix TaxID=2619626 RepID=UPI001687F86B|nr:MULTISPECIES: HNH endonuclease [unclassified Calothrix]MBD2207478.1 HNH endonuclease [Calothrix sp. FACHB-168]MBD2222079.1 HNH endonuclease [Calothrix sp. FACHB-1219]
MDFINQAQNLAFTVRDKVQEVATNATNGLDEVVNEIKNTTVDITTSSISILTDIQGLSTTAAKQGLQTVQNVSKAFEAAAIGATTSSLVIADALQNLPSTATELAAEMPKIANRLRYRAGLRVGDSPRSDSDIIKLFEKIPGTSKLGAKERTIRQFLSDKHGSHIIPRSQGGSNGADNILWEVGVDNIRRGAKVMTVGEQFYIRVYNAVDSIVSNSGTIAKLGITATGTAILTQVMVTAISYSLDLYRGDITVEEYKTLILETAKTAGIATPIVFLLLVAVLALFPEFTVILSAPVVVAGFNALFGMSIAVPIVQSLVRHTQAGGFGNEAAGELSTAIAVKTDTKFY